MTPQQTIAHYRITGRIGAGGMGEVYRATDTKLNREVALKVLPEAFAGDPDRMARFEREAKVLASLNHPNIAQIYGVEEQALVMELVEGESPKGPLPFDEAWKIALQMADALEYAHEKGVVHRDLKPANVKVTPDGVVKLLDFGLAKAFSDTPESPSSDAVNSPTLTMNATVAGVILGTAAYMAPEQAKGKRVDKRADIWSWGVVLYELLTGDRLFKGDDAADTLAQVLTKEPDLGRVPPNVRKVLSRCLEKDPKKRLRDIGEARYLLDERVAAAPTRSRLGLAGWIAAAVVLLAAGLGALAFWPKPAAPPRVVRFGVPLPDKVGTGQYVSVSPDGQKLVLVEANGGLWIRNLDSLEWRLLPETQGAGLPFWSPDSRFLGFAAGNQLKKIDVTGGPPQTLCELPGQAVRTGAWNRDGTIVFNGTQGPLWRVPEAGGVPAAITSLDTAHGDSVHADPSFLPDDKHFLYLRTSSGGALGTYLGSLDAKPAEQPKQRLLASQRAVYYANGYLFFLRESTLMAQPFDTVKFQLKGEPVPVAEHVASSTTVGLFSVSPSGVLAYREGAANTNIQLTWFDEHGQPTGTLGPPAPFFGFVLSPDGKRAAGRDAPQQLAGDIWTLDLARSVRTRFTFRQGPGSFPVWSPDGSRMAFSAGILLDTLFEKDSSGAGEEKQLYQKAGEIKIPTSWSRDGRFLLYYDVSGKGALWVLPLQGDRKPVLLLGTQFIESNGVFSPDMRWIAYISSESGRNELYVRPFVASGPSGAPVLGDGKWQVSRDGLASAPKWRADGKELFFQSLNSSAMMAVDVDGSSPAFQLGTPRQLFSLPLNIGGSDVTADGKRFLLSVPPALQSAAPITVMLNWPEMLKKK